MSAMSLTAAARVAGVLLGAGVALALLIAARPSASFARLPASANFTIAVSGELAVTPSAGRPLLRRPGADARRRSRDGELHRSQPDGRDARGRLPRPCRRARARRAAAHPSARRRQDARDTTLQGLRNGRAPRVRLRSGAARSIDPRGLDPGRDERLRGPSRRHRADADAAGAGLSMARTRIAGRLLSRFAIATVAGFVLAMLLFSVVPLAFGDRSLVVRSGSMAPAIDTGDIVAVHPIAPTAARVGDIVTFDNHGKLTSHRARAIERRGADVVFTTQGDANSGQEHWKVAGRRAHRARAVPRAEARLRRRQGPVADRALRPDHRPRAAARALAAAQDLARRAARAKGSMSWRASAAALALGAVLLMLCGASGSVWGSFTATTVSAGNSIVGAADWVGPQVTMLDPGTPLRGTASLSATATDAGGMSSVTIQRSAAGAGDLERRLHRRQRAVQLPAGHDGARRRRLRPARDRSRRGGQQQHLERSWRPASSTTSGRP